MIERARCSKLRLLSWFHSLTVNTKPPVHGFLRLLLKSFAAGHRKSSCQDGNSSGVLPRYVTVNICCDFVE